MTLALLLCLAWLPPLLYGGDAAYSLVVHEFSGSALPADQAYLSSLIPQRLLHGIGFIDGRFPDVFELERIDEGMNRIERNRGSQALTAALARRDGLVITTRDRFERAASLAGAEKAVRSARLAVDGLGQATTLADSLDPDRRLALSLPQEGSQLAPPHQATAGQTAAGKPELLLYGELSPYLGFLSVRVRLYSVLHGQDIFDHSFFGAWDDISGLTDSIIRPLATAIIGRAYSRVRLQADPAYSRLRVNGQGIESKELLLYQAAELSLEARAAAHATAMASLTVEPGQDYLVPLHLEAWTQRQWQVDSRPAGARVYLDGRYLGTTPLEIEAHGHNQVLRLELDGYNPQSLALDPKLAGLPSLQLLPASGLSFDRLFQQNKDRFLRSLGAFVCSLPVTVLAYGSFHMYDQAIRQLPLGSLDPEDLAAAARLNRGYYGSQIVMWPALAVSIGLGINSLVQFYRYINTVQ